MITVNESTTTFYLETTTSSYVMRVLPDGQLCHVYYGSKIGQDDMRYHNLYMDHELCPAMPMEGKVTSPSRLSYECPTAGRGDFRTPALTVRTPDGRGVNELTYVSYRITDGKPDPERLPHLSAGAGTQTLEILLRDTVARFTVCLYYSVYEEEDLIVRRTEVVNTSGDTLQLTRIASAALDIEPSDFDMIMLEGTWGRERSVSRHALFHGTSSIESRRGATGHQHNPFTALAGKNTDEDSGEVFGFALVYSADYQIAAETDAFANTRLIMGINPETFAWTLEPGASFTAPEALLVYSNTGFNRMSQCFHAASRRYLGACAKPGLKHPLIINNWEAMYYDLDEEKLIKLAHDASGLGIDTLVVDDGWFGHRDTDSGSLGDWYAYDKRFPHGLDSVVKACHENGLNFGIWVEPEMVSEDSDLYRAHPDWCIHAPGRKPVLSRNQMILDLSRPEVVDGVYASIAALLSTYEISYVKWDMNRNITDNGSDFLAPDRQGEHTHRYILGVYDLMDRLTRNFPHIFFEGCSGGGGRFDFGILYYMPQIWTSDDSDAIERLKIQYGTSFVYPPSAMVAHVSACPNHQTGRFAPFKTRGDVAQSFSFGYELDVGILSAEEREQIREQTAKHRSLEPLIANGTFYRLVSPFESNHCAWELVSEDRRTAYALFALRTSEPNTGGTYLKLKGLDPTRHYRVEQLNTVLSGATLMHAGIPVLLPRMDYASVTFDLTAVD